MKSSHYVHAEVVVEAWQGMVSAEEARPARDRASISTSTPSRSLTVKTSALTFYRCYPQLAPELGKLRPAMVDPKVRGDDAVRRLLAQPNGGGDRG